MNKAVVSSWQFSGFFTLLTVQSMVTIAVAVASMSRTFGNPFRITPLTPELMIAYVHPRSVDVSMLFVRARVCG